MLPILSKFLENKILISYVKISAGFLLDKSELKKINFIMFKVKESVPPSLMNLQSPWY